jgi:hypothetical protein
MSHSRLTESQRQYLRERQRLDTQALAAYTKATARLEAATAHRATVVAKEDGLVRAAKNALAQARQALVERVGVEQASVVTGEPIEVKRGPGRPPAV